MIVSIEPITGFNRTANSVDIYTLPYQLDGSGITLYYSIIDTTGISITSGNITLTAQEISVWGLDDGVVIDLALSKLGLTKQL